MEGAMSLLPVEEEKVDAIESRDRHDEDDEDVVLVLAVDVDMKDEATELRPNSSQMTRTQKTTSNVRDSKVCENIR